MLTLTETLWGAWWGLGAWDGPGAWDGLTRPTRNFPKTPKNPNKNALPKPARLPNSRPHSPRTPSNPPPIAISHFQESQLGRIRPSRGEGRPAETHFTLTQSQP